MFTYVLFNFVIKYIFCYRFNVDKVKDLLKLVVYEELEDKRYHSFKPEEMSKHLCELIQQKLTGKSSCILLNYFLSILNK